MCRNQLEETPLSPERICVVGARYRLSGDAAHTAEPLEHQMHIRIETDRLVLRLPRLDDAAGAAEYLADPEVMRYLGGKTVRRADAPSVVQRWLERWEANGFGHFAIERREDGCFLGRVAMIVWDTREWRHVTLADAGEHAQPELGWTLARTHWGNGYATEAARAVRDWALRERRIGQLISLIHPDNLRSQRVAQRLGAQPAEIVTLFDSGPAVVWVHPDEPAHSQRQTVC